MKLTNILEKENNALIFEQHMNNSRTILSESVEGMNALQRAIVEGIYNDLKPLIEASLTSDQVQQLFKGVEQNVSATGNNRTLVGKGKDAVGEVNAVISKVGNWLQNTTPVKGADEKFEQLKSKVSTKFPDLEKQLSGLGAWMKENPGKSAAIIGVVTAIAGLATGPVGGALAGQILRGSAELIKGEKLSTAAGKGIKTAAIGAAVGGIASAFASDAGEALPPAEMAKVEKLVTQYSPEDHEYRPGAGSKVEVYNLEGTKVAAIDVKSTGFSGKDFVDRVNSTVETPAAPAEAPVRDLTTRSGSTVAAPEVPADTSKGAPVRDLSTRASAPTEVPADTSKGAPVRDLSTRSGAADMFKVGDQTMPKDLRTAIEKMSAADRQEVISAWKATATDGVPQDVQRGAQASIDDIVKKYDGAGSSGTTPTEPTRPTAPTEPTRPTRPTAPTEPTAPAANDPFTINGKRMPQDLQNKILKMPGEDGEKAYGAWKVLVGDQAGTNIRASAGAELEKLLAKHAAKKAESVVYQFKPLSEGQIYLLFDRVCSTNNRMLSEGKIWEADSAAAPKMSTWDKIKTKASEFGKNLTTKVTASKLNSAWKSAGQPTDSDEVAAFLVKQGVNAEVVNQTFADMKLPTPKAAQAPAAKEPAAGQDAATDVPAQSSTATDAEAPVAAKPTVEKPAVSTSATDTDATPQPTAVDSGAAKNTNTLYSQIRAEINQLDRRSKRQLMTYLEKQMGA